MELVFNFAGCGLDEVEDNHPIVKTERSIWELRTATRLILNNIDDLQVRSENA